jgi:hypothetical protein
MFFVFLVRIVRARLRKLKQTFMNHFVKYSGWNNLQIPLGLRQPEAGDEPEHVGSGPDPEA